MASKSTVPKGISIPKPNVSMPKASMVPNPVSQKNPNIKNKGLQAYLQASKLTGKA